MAFRTEFLEGYKNGFSRGNNSATLRIKTVKFLNQHLKMVVEERDEVYKIMSELIKKIWVYYFLPHISTNT